MNLKNKIQLVVMATLLGFAGVATAGKQGISFYGGLGLAAAAPSGVNGFTFDPAAAGNVFIAIEEDGWSLEYGGLATMETGTNDPDIEYSFSGSIVSLGYRTLETNSGLYFLLSVGKADVDVTEAETALPDFNFGVDGTAVTLGIGMRLDKTERMELNYSFLGMSPVDAGVGNDFDVHMLSLRYIWGGTPYDPRF